MSQDPTTHAITEAAKETVRALVIPAIHEHGTLRSQEQLVGASIYATFQPNADYAFLRDWALALGNLPALGPDRAERLTDLVNRAANGQHPTDPE